MRRSSTVFAVPDLPHRTERRYCAAWAQGCVLAVLAFALASTGPVRAEGTTFSKLSTSRTTTTAPERSALPAYSSAPGTAARNAAAESVGSPVVPDPRSSKEVSLSQALADWQQNAAFLPAEAVAPPSYDPVPPVLAGFPIVGQLWHVFDTLSWPPPETRHRGMGHPLLRESWRRHPLSAGWFMGVVQGSPLLDDWVGGNQGFFAGYRFGWDFDHYWGLETRLAFGTIRLWDSAAAIAAQQAADDANGVDADSTFRYRFNAGRDATVFLWDIDALYYPWGDAAWRPYMLVGLGLARHRFQDRLSTVYEQTALEIPIGLGVKYRWNSRLAFRAEVCDNMAFHSEFNPVHDLTITGGVEVHFGGRPTAYWPWNPGRHYW